MLLGDPDRIRSVAVQNGVDLPEDIEILAPEEVLNAYVEPLVELRKAQGYDAGDGSRATD